jgi:hypothetical protein
MTIVSLIVLFVVAFAAGRWCDQPRRMLDGE